MNVNIVSAKTSGKTNGTLDIEQMFVIDASEEFNDFIDDNMSEDEILGAAEDLDYVGISNTELESHFWNAIRGTHNIDWNLDNIDMTFYNNPKPTTVEQAREYSKKIQMEVRATISYSPEYEVETSLEKALTKSFLTVSPKSKLV